MSDDSILSLEYLQRAHETELETDVCVLFAHRIPERPYRVKHTDAFGTIEVDLLKFKDVNGQSCDCYLVFSEQRSLREQWVMYELPPEGGTPKWVTSSHSEHLAKWGADRYFTRQPSHFTSLIDELRVKAFEHGQRSYAENIDPDDNPYNGALQSRQASAWHKGWVAAAKHAKAKL